jgi:hypothetical protein
VVSSVATLAPTAGHNAVIRLTDVPQALGYKVYIGTGASQPANSSFFFYGRFPNQSANSGGAGGTGIVLQGAIPTTGANPPSADTSAYGAGYDGILAWAMGASSGYNVKINSTFSTSNPGSEFQSAFSSLYNSVKADPDRILFNGADRKQQSDTLKAGSSNNYFLQVAQSELSGPRLGRRGDHERDHRQARRDGGQPLDAAGRLPDHLRHPADPGHPGLQRLVRLQRAGLHGDRLARHPVRLRVQLLLVRHAPVLRAGVERLRLRRNRRLIHPSLQGPAASRPGPAP